MTLDPITIEVVLNRVRETTAAMAHALFHSGYSPILRESQDGTAGLTDAAGRVIMVGGGIQYHSLLYTRSVESILAAYPADRMAEGDTFISNDPYKAGNSHVPDFVVATPVFYVGYIIAFGVSVAHKADVGGIVPGSSGAAAREIFHDGLLVPPVRYWTKDGVIAEVDAIVRNNSRVPDVVIGDLRGQVGATRLGRHGFRRCATNTASTPCWRPPVACWNGPPPAWPRKSPSGPTARRRARDSWTMTARILPGRCASMYGPSRRGIA